MLKIILIRHGKTYGNTIKRYIGTTDEPLLPSSIQSLKSKIYPRVRRVYTSPLLRASQTAEIIYSDIKPRVVEGLKECDFGEFENKNYIELSNSENYNRWVASNGTLPFPKGEDIESFKERCLTAFLQIVKENINTDISVAVVAHGGTIMSILEKLSVEKQSFYSWAVENGEGYECEVSKDNTLRVVRKI